MIKPDVNVECRDLFRSAYENRYTWDPDFNGYKGSCVFYDGINEHKGLFSLDSNFKPIIIDINDDNITKLISSQLWEVCIHRVRRGFDKVHGDNTFTLGDTNEIGMEILVGGKNSGDKYRIKDNIVTMVYRNIHGSLINIYTNKVLHTGSGYLSSNYTSQYFEPSTKSPKSAKCHFKDEFICLEDECTWVLSSRTIDSEAFNEMPPSSKKFLFQSLIKT
ncbi:MULTISPECIES: DUF3386 domain-containing protein [unclassified Prochlorococcus]|uniref:DUF3386 domain-containing protein n=1 Tax=unclassified Prochlorococcus TaxID=2627481 RepID=UPI000A9673E6|nr:MULTISPECIES: DUF3386 domain-containing protein [unclassified Prochlorococcus]